MTIYNEILNKLYTRQTPSDVALNLLEQIVLVLRDDNLDDSECFYRIEAIIQAFNDAGISCGSRHDFDFMD